jgi:hypothetical protein
MGPPAASLAGPSPPQEIDIVDRAESKIAVEPLHVLITPQWLDATPSVGKKSQTGLLSDQAVRFLRRCIRDQSLA